MTYAHLDSDYLLTLILLAEDQWETEKQQHYPPVGEERRQTKDALAAGHEALRKAG